MVKVHLYEGFLFYGYTCPEVLFSCRCLVFGKNWSNYRSIVYIFIGTGILSHEGCSSVFACQGQGPDSYIIAFFIQFTCRYLPVSVCSVGFIV